MTPASISPQAMPSQIHDRVPARTNDAIVQLAEAIAKARCKLRGEPPPVWFLLPEAERDSLVRAAVRCVRGLEPTVRSVALHRATTPPLPSTDEQKLRDVALMRFAVETFEAALEGLAQ